MKNLIAVLTTFALLGFAIPAFACDGHKAAADKDETTTTSAEKTDEHTCEADCDHSKKKKAKAETAKADGEV